MTGPTIDGAKLIETYGNTITYHRQNDDDVEILALFGHEKAEKQEKTDGLYWVKQNVATISANDVETIDINDTIEDENGFTWHIVAHYYDNTSGNHTLDIETMQLITRFRRPA